MTLPLLPAAQPDDMWFTTPTSGLAAIKQHAERLCKSVPDYTVGPRLHFHTFTFTSPRPPARAADPLLHPSTPSPLHPLPMSQVQVLEAATGHDAGGGVSDFIFWRGSGTDATERVFTHAGLERHHRRQRGGRISDIYVYSGPTGEQVRLGGMDEGRLACGTGGHAGRWVWGDGWNEQTRVGGCGNAVV